MRSTSIRHSLLALTPREIFSKRFYEARTAMQVDCDVAARAMGISVKKLREIENGECAPDSDDLEKAIKIYDLRLDFFFEGNDIRASAIKHLSDRDAVSRTNKVSEIDDLARLIRFVRNEECDACLSIARTVYSHHDRGESGKSLLQVCELIFARAALTLNNPPLDGG